MKEVINIEDVQESIIAEAIAADLAEYLCYAQVAEMWALKSGGRWSAIGEHYVLAMILKELRKRFPKGFGWETLSNIKMLIELDLLSDADFEIPEYF